MPSEQNAYIKHKGRIVEKGDFEHVFSLTLDPTDQRQGLLRCITSREGDLTVKGYRDRSVLHKVRSIDGLEKYEIAEPLEIKGSDDLMKKLSDEDHDFIGFEDPDLVYDPEAKILHLYFTIPLIKKREDTENIVLLGHAQGTSLDDLEMTEPVVNKEEVGATYAKELSLAPVNSNGVRLNLVESKDKIDGVSYSTVRVAKAKGFGPPWELGETVFHPKKDGYPWCAGHASPGPLLPREFIDVGEGKLLGFMNGREANTIVEGKTKYGMFSVGLFIYDFENGKIDWVSKEPLIIDSEAKTITFASQFVLTGNGEGVLYAHVDDSFVRAYTIKAEEIKKLVDL